MSTAILMAAGAKQSGIYAGASHLSADQDGLEGSSFAKSLDESVRNSDLLQRRSSADGVTALRGDETTAFTKKLGELTDVPAEARKKINLAQQKSGNSELKSVVAEKITPQPAMVVAGAQGKSTMSEPVTEEVESPSQGEKTVDDPSPSSLSSHSTSAAELTDEGLEPPIGIAKGDRLIVSSGGEPVIHKKMAPAGKVQEAVSARKAASILESAATSKTTQKTIGTPVNAVLIEGKAAEGSLPVSATQVEGLAVAAGVGSTTEVGKTTELLSDVVSGAQSSAGVDPKTANGSVRKEATHAARAGVTDTEPTTATIAGEVTESPKKSDLAPQTITAAAIAAVSDGDNKTKNPPAAATTLIHAMSAAVGVSPSIVPGIVESANTPGNLTAAKSPVGDVGSYPGLQAGSGEQNGPVVAAALMDGTPLILTATPTSLEVGIQNGTHGWLKVRAEMADGGMVNTSVSAASSAGNDMLHRELPALTAYLQEEKVAVNAVVVHTTVPGAESRSLTGGMNDHGGGQKHQKSNDRQEQRPDIGTLASGQAEARSSQGLNGTGEDLLTSARYAIGGSWLSVRA